MRNNIFLFLIRIRITSLCRLKRFTHFDRRLFLSCTSQPIPRVGSRKVGVGFSLEPFLPRDVPHTHSPSQDLSTWYSRCCTSLDRYWFVSLDLSSWALVESREVIGGPLIHEGHLTVSSHDPSPVYLLPPHRSVGHNHKTDTTDDGGPVERVYKSRAKGVNICPYY